MAIESCCCCMSVKTGTVVIGVLSLCGMVISAISNVINLVENTSIPSADVIVTSRDMAQLQQNAIMYGLVLKIVFIALLIFASGNIIISAYMLVGAIKKIPSYMFPWLAVGFGGILFFICVSIAVIIINAVFSSTGAAFLMILILGLTSALYIYCWLVVYAHYKAIIAETCEKQPA